MELCFVCAFALLGIGAIVGAIVYGANHQYFIGAVCLALAVGIARDKDGSIRTNQ